MCAVPHLPLCVLVILCIFSFSFAAINDRYVGFGDWLSGDVGISGLCKKNISNKYSYYSKPFCALQNSLPIVGDTFTIREIGVVDATPIAGIQCAAGDSDGPALDGATLSGVCGMAVFNNGLYFIEQGGYLRVLSEGYVKTLRFPSKDKEINLTQPAGIAIDATHNLIYVLTLDRVTWLNLDGTHVGADTTLAGASAIAIDEERGYAYIARADSGIYPIYSFRLSSDGLYDKTTIISALDPVQGLSILDSGGIIYATQTSIFAMDKVTGGWERMQLIGQSDLTYNVGDYPQPPGMERNLPAFAGILSVARTGKYTYAVGCGTSNFCVHNFTVWPRSAILAWVVTVPVERIPYKNQTWYDRVKETVLADIKAAVQTSSGIAINPDFIGHNSTESCDFEVSIEAPLYTIKNMGRVRETNWERTKQLVEKYWEDTHIYISFPAGGIPIHPENVSVIREIENSLLSDIIDIAGTSERIKSAGYVAESDKVNFTIVIPNPFVNDSFQELLKRTTFPNTERAIREYNAEKSLDLFFAPAWHMPWDPQRRQNISLLGELANIIQTALAEKTGVPAKEFVFDVHTPTIVRYTIDSHGDTAAVFCGRIPGPFKNETTQQILDNPDTLGAAVRFLVRINSPINVSFLFPADGFGFSRTLTAVERRANATIMEWLLKELELDVTTLTSEPSNTTRYGYLLTDSLALFCSIFGRFNNVTTYETISRDTQWMARLRTEFDRVTDKAGISIRFNNPLTPEKSPFPLKDKTWMRQVVDAFVQDVDAVVGPSGWGSVPSSHYGFGWSISVAASPGTSYKVPDHSHVDLLATIPFAYYNQSTQYALEHYHFPKTHHAVSHKEKGIEYFGKCSKWCVVAICVALAILLVLLAICCLACCTGRRRRRRNKVAPVFYTELPPPPPPGMDAIRVEGWRL